MGSYYWVTSTDAVLSKHQSAVAAGERGTRPRSCFQCYLSACLWSNRFFGGFVKEVLMKCGSCIRCTLLVTSFYSRCRSSNAILQIMHAAQLSYYLLTCCPYLHWSLFLVLTALCVHHGPWASYFRLSVYLYVAELTVEFTWHYWDTALTFEPRWTFEACIILRDTESPPPFFFLKTQRHKVELTFYWFAEVIRSRFSCNFVATWCMRKGTAR